MQETQQGELELQRNLFNARYVDLAPMIYRQRLVIEGRREVAIGSKSIREYLSKLSDVCGMTRLMEPVTHRSERFGWAGWIHWESSGAHFYAWDSPFVFFSVDIYTCLAFDETKAVNFTETFFRTSHITAKSF
jgi:hypothetical protein